MKKFTHSRKKPAFAMIMAMTFIVILGTILALSISLTSTTTKKNLETYFYEQMEILADSAREYAMFRIGNTPCNVGTFNFTQDNLYDITINVQYVTRATCPAPNAALTFAVDPSLVKETAIIDVAVSLNNAASNTPEQIRYYKRYIENINQ